MLETMGKKPISQQCHTSLTYGMINKVTIGYWITENRFLTGNF
jgi:hypothetical protein